MKKRRFVCGYIFLVAVINLIQAFVWLLAFLVALGGDADIPFRFSVFAFLVLGTWIVSLVLVLLFWSFVVDPVGRVVAVRRGWKRRVVGFDEIVEVEVPPDAQIMPRHVMLHLANGEEIMCPFVSQGYFARSARLRAMEDYLHRRGLPVVVRSGPPVRMPRFIRDYGRPKPPIAGDGSGK